MNLKAVQNENQNEDDYEIEDTGWMKYIVRKVKIREPEEKTKEEINKELEEELEKWL